MAEGHWFESNPNYPKVSHYLKTFLLQLDRAIRLWRKVIGSNPIRITIFNFNPLFFNGLFFYLPARSQLVNVLFYSIFILWSFLVEFDN